MIKITIIFFMSSKETFYILDGNAILHRAWHALPPLATKDGKLVNAVYGFLLILLKLLRDEKPTFLAVAFDLAGPTFRHEAYEDYKATRVKAPDELYEQLPILKEVLKAFGIPVLEKPGYEADDVVGTLATKFTQKDLQTYIVTGDLDTLQLVRPNISVYTFVRGISESFIYDEKAVKARYGLRPDQMIDYKALRGDPSDNIKGVRGIGEKTATELLKTFGSIEKIYQALKKPAGKEKIRPKVIETLLAGEEDAKMSKDLVTIRCDVPIDFSLAVARVKEPNRELLIPIFSELGFRTLAAKLPGEKQEDDKKITNKKITKVSYQLIHDKKEAEDLLIKLKKSERISIRTTLRSSNIFSHDFIGVALAWGEGQAAFVPQKLVSIFSSIFSSDTIVKIGHNLKRDFCELQNQSLVFSLPYEDIMIASYLLSPGSRAHELRDLVFDRFGRQLSVTQEQGTLLPLTAEELCLPVCEEADYIFRLQAYFINTLEERAQLSLFRDMEMPLIETLVIMERNGILIDVLYLETMKKKLQHRLDELSKEIHEAAGEDFNINSPAQLKKILFEKLKIPAKVRKTAGGELSTAASELERLRGLHPIIDFIFEYRELSKLVSTYVESLPKLVRLDTKRVHTSFNQAITSTGRLSSSDPNLQNIPIRSELGREIRKAFIAPSGFELVSADYSQIELRLVAAIARVRRMIDAFRDGADIHTTTAAEIWNVKPDEVTKEQRRAAKAINFGIVYGIGPNSLAESAGISFAEAKEFIQRYFDLYPELRAYLDETKALAASLGYVETLFGRRRYLPEINSGVPPIRAAAERMAINAPIQGSAADLMKLAMISVDGWVKKEFGVAPNAPVKLLLQVHDELVLEVKKELVPTVAKKVKELMEDVRRFDVPIVVEVEVGRSWGELSTI